LNANGASWIFLEAYFFEHHLLLSSTSLFCLVFFPLNEIKESSENEMCRCFDQWLS